MAFLPAQGAPGSIRSRTGRLLFAALPLVCVAGLSCSETQQPLEWRDAVRGGLGETRRVTSDQALVSSAHDSVVVATGSASRWLVGKVERSGTTHSARAFLRWDVTGLPEGEITSAHVDLLVAGLDASDPQDSGPFQLRLYEVRGEWSEDSLNLGPLPEVNIGAPLADATIDTAGLGAADGVLTRANLFEDPDLIALIDDWRADSSSNRGIMLRASSASPAGVLRFFSREGTDPAAGSALATPLLVVEVQGTDTTTVSLEAVADAYAMGATGPASALPESLLVVSSGFVQRAALRLNPAVLLCAPEGGNLPTEAVIRGVLRLSLMPGEDWSLPVGRTIQLRVYEAEVDWASPTPLASATLGAYIGGLTVAGADSTVEVPIAPHLRRLVEGEERSLVLECRPEIGGFASILLKNQTARRGRPELEVVFGPLGGRRGR